MEDVGIRPQMKNHMDQKMEHYRRNCLSTGVYENRRVRKPEQLAISSSSHVSGILYCNHVRNLGNYFLAPIVRSRNLTREFRWVWHLGFGARRVEGLLQGLGVWGFKRLNF